MDYKNTPSFYNNEEYFNRYLGKTSYYLNLQSVVEKLIGLIKPRAVLELGSALGTTSIRMAEIYSKTVFKGADLRPDVVDLANKAAEGLDNVSFFSEDMCETVKNNLEEYDFIFMLYSFHHILDPIENKITFLKSCYSNMKTGSYLSIMETFLPESAKQMKDDTAIISLWEQRSLEGYASTYWAALQELSENGLEFAKRVATTSKTEEFEAGEHVNKREDEYLVKFSWLEEIAKEVGFDVIISEPVNCIEEKAILLRKN